MLFETRAGPIELQWNDRGLTAIRMPDLSPREVRAKLSAPDGGAQSAVISHGWNTRRPRRSYLHDAFKRRTAATAASQAFPPRARTSYPACKAQGVPATTANSFARRSCFSVFVWSVYSIRSRGPLGRSA